MANGKTALVIGASRGIGLATVADLVGRGWSVTGTVRHENTKLHELALRHPEHIRIATVDMAVQPSVDAFLDRLAGPPFDLVVLNGAVGQPGEGDVMALSEADLLRVMFVNGVAPVRLATRLVPLVRDGSGVIAFVSSRSGVVALFRDDNEDLYRASKATLNIFTRGFAARLDPARGLTVLTLSPGWVRTDMGGMDATLAPEQSAAGMVASMVAAEGRGDHQFVTWDGQPVAW